MEKPRTLEECAAGCAEHYVVSLGLRFHLQLWIWHLFVFLLRQSLANAYLDEQPKPWAHGCLKWAKHCNDLPGSAFRFRAHVTIDLVLTFTTMREPRSQALQEVVEDVKPRGMHEYSSHGINSRPPPHCVTGCGKLLQRPKEQVTTLYLFRPSEECVRFLHTCASTIVIRTVGRTVGDVTHMPSRIATTHFRLQT